MHVLEVHLDPVLGLMQTLPGAATKCLSMVLVLGWETWVHLFQTAAVTNDWLIRNYKGLVPTLNLLPSQLVEALSVTDCISAFLSAARSRRCISQEHALGQMQPSTSGSVSRELDKNGLEGNFERDDVSDL